MKQTIEQSLIKLMHHFGPLYWWPAENDIEMMIGAILVQNTNWNNVEHALKGFSRPFNGQDVLDIPIDHLQDIIRPSGFYTRKSQTIQALLTWYKTYDFDVEALRHIDTMALRTQLLSLKGIGKETADSILLYAFNRPVFVVDAYLKKFLKHINCFTTDNYDEIQYLMTTIFPPDLTLYQELHAVIVEYGKLNGKAMINDPLNDGISLINVPLPIYFDVMHQEPTFETIHKSLGLITRVSHPDPYTGFVYTIIGQLLSAASAHAIFTRFIARYPTVQSILDAPFEDIKSVGLTKAKTNAIVSLCERIYDKSFDFEELRYLSDEDAISTLSQLKGFGRWSAIIILIHTYNRLNLTSYDDIALRKSVARILHQPTVSRDQFDTYMKRFEPYKTVASLFLWKYNKMP